MLREMRRKNQSLSAEEAEAVLLRGSAGVLSLSGADGEPYGVPLSYVYDRGKLYFHCAVSGHKLELIRQNPKASFCVIDLDQVIPEAYTTYFRSVIACGTVKILADEAGKQGALMLLAQKYSPEKTEEENRRAIAEAWDRVAALEFAIDRLTGKMAKELVPKTEQ